MKEKISNAILTTCVVRNKDTGIPRAVDIIHKLFIEEQVRMLEALKIQIFDAEHLDDAIMAYDYYISTLKNKLDNA